MEKKEIKKYYLAERICVENRNYETYNEYEELKKAISKYNSKSKNPFFCSKPVCEINDEGSFDVTFVKYRKLCKEAQTLKGIDLLTTAHDTNKSLKDELCSCMKDKRNQVSIVYRLKGDIETKQILYSKHKAYLNRDGIIESMLEHVKDIEHIDRTFFINMCYDKTFCSIPNIIPFLDKIEMSLSRAYWSKNPSNTMYASVANFVDYYTTKKDGSENYLNLRNLALYCHNNKPKDIVKQDIYEQLMMDLEDKPKKLEYKPKSDK